MHPSFRSVIITCLAGVFSWGIAHAQDTQPQSEEDSRSGHTTSGGLRAYLDPATGRLIDNPPYGKSTLKMSPKALGRFSTSHFGLIEQALPNGLRLVNLRGRFRQGSVATVNEDGTLKVKRIGPEMFLGPAGSTFQKWVESAEKGEELGLE